MVMGVAGAPGESSSVTSAAKMQHKFAVRKASHLAPLPPPPIPPTPAPVPPWVHHRCIHSGWLHRSLYTFAADHTPRFITVGEGKHHPCRPPFANCNRLASPTLLHPDTSASQ